MDADPAILPVVSDATGLPESHFQSEKSPASI